MRAERAKRAAVADFPTWAEANFRIEETEEPIVLARHQKAVLRYLLQRDPDGAFKFKTIIYSEPKKGGKTTISGAVIRWAAETWGKFGEIYCVGNDAEQARERGFKMMSQSIQLEPTFRPTGAAQSTGILRGKWIVKSKEAYCIPTGTKVKAVAADYKGEAGANPVLTVWTEVWGIIHKDANRFWAEMAPSPTREHSIRWVETYAGYEGESELLWTLYESTVLNGRQITAEELGDVGSFTEAPEPDDLVPIYVDERAGIVALWDHGEVAHRQPWQQGKHGEAYYANERASQTPSQYIRLHHNEWVSAESAFIAIEWWDALVRPLPLPPNTRQPLVIALDAAVTGDCFGFVVVSRDPDQHTSICSNPVTCFGCGPYVQVRASHIWTPPPGGPIIYRPDPDPAKHKGDTPWEMLEWYRENFNIAEVAYDPYQLHDFCTDAQRRMRIWFRPFAQMGERLIADSDFYRLIVEQRIHHDGNLEVREHMTNANAKLQPNEDSKMRIVKKSEKRRIDLAVSISMASRECLRLNI